MNFWNRQFLTGLGLGFLISFLFVKLSLPAVLDDKAASQAGLKNKVVTAKASPETKAEVAADSYQPSGKTDPLQENNPNHSAQVRTGNTSKATEPEKSAETTVAAKVITITIPRGSSGGEIAALLQEKGVITDNKAFLQQVKDMKAANKIHIGTYTFNKGEDMKVIIERLTKG